MVVVACIVDWVCVAGFGYTGFGSAYFTFVANLTICISGFHLALVALVLVNLQHLALDHVLEKKLKISQPKPQIIKRVEDSSHGIPIELPEISRKESGKTTAPLDLDTVKLGPGQ